MKNTKISYSTMVSIHEREKRAMKRAIFTILAFVVGAVLAAPAVADQQAGEEKAPELYAKVIRPLEGSSKRYLIHFTSIPPRMRERLDRLARMG